MANSLARNVASRRISFVSWNVRGLGKPTKLNKVLSHLDNLGAQIAFIQETHLNVSDHTKVRRRWVSQSFHSLFNSKARGVAILIHHSVPFVASNVIADRNGRYVIVTGTLYETPLILANVYGPNHDDEQFFVKFFSTLPNIDTHLVIIAGDLNCCLQSLDTSARKKYSMSKSAKVINRYLNNYGLADIWRRLNPNAQGYSFFSPVHHTYTRIDYFLVDNKLLPLIQSCSYHARVISDHSPLLMAINFVHKSTSRPPWRLNTSLLSDSDFAEYISQQIDFFIDTNATGGTNHSTLWEAFKAYMRGQLISRLAYDKQMRSFTLTNLMHRIQSLESQNIQSPSPALYKEKLLLKTEFENLSTINAEEMILKSRHTYYEHGDKPSRLLAHQLRQSAASRVIAEINTSSGLTRDPQEINNAFRNFYVSLYTSEQQPTTDDLLTFFANLSIPKLSEDIAENLDRPITAEEVGEAIMATQSGRSPGPDGYPAEFFKRFSAKLIPLLHNMFTESLASGILPKTLRSAQISLLLKKNKDPHCCGSYRPISLLNVDEKILAKVLARRLERILPDIISADQTGFIRNRFSFFNVRRLFNIIYHPSESPIPEVVVSLDAEKAFDRVEWSYLFYTLEKFGFGKMFISWVKLLYTSPLSSVRTNNTFSKYFQIGRGTRQGCPLSPLLFALAIEPLSLTLSQTSLIKGVMREGQEQKVSLYADDLLLYISDPAQSLPHVLNILDTFHHLSGYKLNLQKSELFPINEAAHQYTSSSLPFKVSNTFTYLGVNVVNKFSNLFSANFSPLLKQTEINLEHWRPLPLSVAGRINSI